MPSSATRPSASTARLFARMGELGLTAAPFPEAVGGAGFSYLGWTLVMEELGAADMAMAVIAVRPHPVAVPGRDLGHRRAAGALAAGDAGRRGARGVRADRAARRLRRAAIRTRAERVGPADAPTAIG